MDPVSALLAFLGGLAGKTFSHLADSLGDRLAKGVESAFRRVFETSPKSAGATQSKNEKAAARERLEDLLREDLSFRREFRELMAILCQKAEATPASSTIERPAARSAGNVSMRFGDVRAGKFTPIGQMSGGTVITADTVLMGWDPEEHASRKTALATLELVDGHVHAGLSLARDALRAAPSSAHASYCTGVALLMNDIRSLDASLIAEAERHLARAADDPDLAGPCCYPRAAIRYDHYRYHRKPEPEPSLEALITLEGRHWERARAWPYAEVDDRLGTSAEFRQLWWG
jgi:hypothetical protein